MFPISPESLSVAGSTFAVIALAEIGDKSQLVCMTLAARHRHGPVLAGAAVAFLALNTLAVLFGAGVAAWLPEWLIAALVALLFALFGVLSLRNRDEEEDAPPRPISGHGLFLTTLMLIFLAEFGDKTQIAVAALAGGFAPLPVWLGASAALVTVSALGVWAGCTLLQRLPIRWLHRLAGFTFLAFAAAAGWRAVSG